MDEPKKQIEDAVWSYVIGHRPLKLFAIAVSAIGVVGGALGTLERPFMFIRSKIEYAIGLSPKPEGVIFERNAFIVGVLLFEAHRNSHDSESKRQLFDVVEGSFRAVGYSDPSLRAAQTKGFDESQRIIERVADSFEGYLESKAHAARRLFSVGKTLTALYYAGAFSDATAVKQLDSELREQYAQAQDSLQYRLPTLPLLPPAQYAVSTRGYLESAHHTEEVLKSFLGIAGTIDPRVDRQRWRQ